MVKHNKTFYNNRELIKNEYLRILKKDRRMPSQLEVGKNIGLTQTTISMHLNSIDITELVDPFKFYGDSVLMGLMERAQSGDGPSAKLFFNIVYDWAEKREIKADVKVDAKVKVDTKVKISPKIAKMIGDALVKEEK